MNYRGSRWMNLFGVALAGAVLAIAGCDSDDSEPTSGSCADAKRSPHIFQYFGENRRSP